jgi:hypothetical protein
MIIVRLLSPEPFWLVGTTKVYSGTGADIVMESITPTIAKTNMVGEIAIFRQLRAQTYGLGSWHAATSLVENESSDCPDPEQ